LEQFKSLTDLREYIKNFERYFARPIVEGEHPTLYLNSNSSNKEVFNGIQRDDYIFSSCGNWIIPSNEHGLSFSSHWQHLKGIYRMKAKRNAGKSVSVYWVIEKFDIPSGLRFVIDPRDKKGQHYLLTVCTTQPMKVSELREKLEWIADRMSVIKDAQVAL